MCKWLVLRESWRVLDRPLSLLVHFLTPALSLRTLSDQETTSAIPAMLKSTSIPALPSLTLPLGPALTGLPTWDIPALAPSRICDSSDTGKAYLYSNDRTYVHYMDRYVSLSLSLVMYRASRHH